MSSDLFERWGETIVWAFESGRPLYQEVPAELQCWGNGDQGLIKRLITRGSECSLGIPVLNLILSPLSVQRTTCHFQQSDVLRLSVCNLLLKILLRYQVLRCYN